MVRPAGELDAVGAPIVADAVRDAAGQYPYVLLDLRLVGFLDAGGVRALLRGHEEARVRGSLLVVVGACHTVGRVLRACGAHETLVLCDLPRGASTITADLPVEDILADAVGSART